MNTSKLVRDINEGVNLKENAGLLTEALGGLDNKIALINLAFSYSILYENIDGTYVDPDIDHFLDEINEIMKDAFVNKDTNEDLCKRAEALRNEVIGRVDVLTSFTDRLQVFEYVLNRIRGRYEEFEDDYDIDALVEKCFGYMFSDTDNAAVNERIREILSQLPVRMTKQKFYETVGETMSVYKGSDLSSLMLYDYMLRISGMIYKTKGNVMAYKDIFELIANLTITDFDELSKEQFESKFARLTEAGEFISETFDRLSLIIEVVNNLLVYLLTKAYEDEDRERESARFAILKTLDAFKGEYLDVSDYISETEVLFSNLEGFMERTAQEYARLDSAREILEEGSKSVIADAGLKAEYKVLWICSILMSESRFADYSKFDDVRGIVTDKELNEVRNALIADYDGLFSGLSKKDIYLSASSLAQSVTPHHTLSTAIFSIVLYASL